MKKGIPAKKSWTVDSVEGSCGSSMNFVEEVMGFKIFY